jgi:hypothetical protein
MNSKPSTLLNVICHLENLLQLVIITSMIQFQRLSNLIHLFSKELSRSRISIIIHSFPAFIITLQSDHSLTLQIHILTPKISNLFT